MKPITASIQIVSILMLIALVPGAAGNIPVRAAQTSPDAAPPAGLSTEDWAQINALLAAGLPSQQAYLKASNTGIQDLFGRTVAISGDTVVVGTPCESSNATGVNGNQDDNSAYDSGAAYVFTRSGTTWSQQAYLKASNTGAKDYFGTSVAIDGDTLVVGAEGEASNATGVNGNQTDNSAYVSGAAYIFTRSGTTWSQQAYLKASNTQSGDIFGFSVSISGDTLVVGARGEASNATGVDGDQNNNLAPYSGAAYVFVRSGTIWSQQAYLKASNTETRDYFGFSVAIDGDTVVVGAYGEASNATGVNGNQADNSAPYSGAAYVFTRSGTNWSQQAYLKASNPDIDDRFGLFPVAISGDTVVVGARYEDSNATGVDGDQGDNSATNSGAAYVFTRSGTTWSQQAYLKASNTGTDDRFSTSVAVSGDTLVVGAIYEDSNATGVNGNQKNNSATNSGAAYVFTRSGTTWSQQAYLKASNTGVFDRFGHTVAVSGSTVLVGADGEDSAATGVNGIQSDNSAYNSGAAYVYQNYTTILRSAGAYDGHILESGENTNAGGSLDATSTVFRLGDAAGDRQYRAILSFNTGGLPDNAVITRVTLKIKKQGLLGTNPFTILGRLKADIRKPYFSATPWLVTTDFQAAADKVMVGTFTMNPWNNWYIGVIESAGYPYINKTGATQFRLRFYKDDNDDGNADYMKFYSGNYIYPLSRPALLIEYYVP